MQQSTKKKNISELINEIFYISIWVKTYSIDKYSLKKKLNIVGLNISFAYFFYQKHISKISHLYSLYLM